MTPGDIGPTPPLIPGGSPPPPIGVMVLLAASLGV
jgi:hypothetical protein